MALESCTREGIEGEYGVAFTVKNSYSVIDFSPAIREIMRDVSRNTAKEIIATMFHNSVAAVIRKMVRHLSRERELSSVVLTGGTFQNRYLLHRTLRLLSSDGMTVMTNHQVPPNDACISLGQAYLIRERLKRG
jgi:hydrogenase maturation protein HypF